jgi:hypothetical protein
VVFLDDEKVALNASLEVDAHVCDLIPREFSTAGADVYAALIWPPSFCPTT